MNKFLIGMGVVATVVIVLLGGSFYTIDQGELGVTLRNGKVTGTATAGLGFKAPFIDSVVSISTQTRTVVFKGLTAYSKDQQPATATVSVTYSVDPSQVEEVYASYKSLENLQSRTIERQVPTQLENVFGKYTAISAVQDRVKFGADLTKYIKESLVGYPVIISSVQIEGIDFSDAYERSVEERMKAEVEVQTQKQNLEKERISADITVTKAQAEADSQLARAKAEAESIRIKGDAEASAINARAKALAQNGNLVDLVKAEKWDGKLPTTMLPNSAVPFIEAKK